MLESSSSRSSCYPSQPIHVKAMVSAGERCSDVYRVVPSAAGCMAGTSFRRVVRYKHCVNSSIHSADSFLAASAARGKLRRDGRRPPLSWCAPCDGLSGDLTHVFKVLNNFSLPECGLPHLNGRCLDDLSVSMPPKKMSMGRFHQLGRLIFVQLLEWTEEQASRLSSRHVLCQLRQIQWASLRLTVHLWEGRRVRARLNQLQKQLGISKCF